jgi:hypothetical protein
MKQNRIMIARSGARSFREFRADLLTRGFEWPKVNGESVRAIGFRPGLLPGI